MPDSRSGPPARILTGLTLFCFAVEEEARPFRRRLQDRAKGKVLVTGMGRRNAERAIQAALEAGRPATVLTCGFAGGLAPDLETGTVLFEAEAGHELVTQLERAGARRARFICANRVATGAGEKQALWKSTGADAVEMESEAIRNICRRHGVPCATVRVILDTAAEDLPLDFNAVMTPELRLDPAKLAKAIATSPRKIPALLRFQRQTRAAAESLARFLAAL